MPALARYFNVEVDSAGGNYTLNRGRADFDMEPPFANRHGSSLRVVYGQAPSTLPNSANPTPSPGPPTLTPTPGPASPTATPRPVGTPGNVADLARQANEAFQRAQDALRNGDFTTYANEITKAQDLVRQLAQQTGGQ